MQCLNTYEEIIIDLNDYLGGVAIWGAIPAVFDTANGEFDAGIHVHARYAHSRKKIIDKTFSTVRIKHKEEIHLIDEKSAIAFAMSALFGIDMIALVCNHCGNLILDEGKNAVIPSTQHVCNACLVNTHTMSPCVANPLVALKQQLNDDKCQRTLTHPNRHIRLDPELFPGGIQLWGSNPAILWTTPQQEESGIHVHAYNDEGKRTIDNTYSHVEINGKILSPEMIRTLQVQQSLSEIKKYLGCIACPKCNLHLFHEGICAATPQKKHHCTTCRTTWETKPIISNPAFLQLTTFYKKGKLNHEMYL